MGCSVEVSEVTQGQSTKFGLYSVVSSWGKVWAVCFFVLREGTRATRDCPGSFPGGPRGPRMTP